MSTMEARRMTIPPLWFRAGATHSRIEWTVVELRKSLSWKSQKRHGTSIILGILRYQYELQEIKSSSNSKQVSSGDKHI